MREIVSQLTYPRLPPLLDTDTHNEQQGMHLKA